MDHTQDLSEVPLPLFQNVFLLFNYHSRGFGGGRTEQMLIYTVLTMYQTLY